MQDRAMHKWAERLRSCRQWTEKQARDVLARQRASGQGVTVFARQMGFVPQRLFWWRGKLGSPQEPAPPANAAFVRAVVRDTPSLLQRACIVVEIDDGVRVHVNQADAITAGWVALLLSTRGRS